MSIRARSGGVRRLRAACIVAGAAMGAVAMFAATAQAAPSGAPVPHNLAGALSSHALPPDIVHLTHPLKPGTHGAPFSPRSAATPAIVGGTTANSTDFPYVVAILTPFADGSNKAVLCTGTIIAPTKVLTAGHCDTDLQGVTTFVVAGVNSINDTNGTTVTVASTWTDPSFNIPALDAGAPAPVDDVAVLTLSSPLPSDKYPPVSLTAQNDGTPYAAGTNATIVGYGETGFDVGDGGVLHQATLPIQSDQACTVMTGYDPSRMTCAGLSPNGGVGTCHGDSGGPLLVNGVEAAITDWGAPDSCAAAGKFSVFERLSTYHDTITADFTRPDPGNMDFTGDGHTDLLTVDGSGNLNLYAGSGFANDGFGGFDFVFPQIGSGWGGFTKVFRVTNWNGDGLESIMAVSPDGTLFQFPTNGFGGFTTTNGVVIGNGFNFFARILVVNNWTGDGLPDMLGITSDGTMLLYEGNERGGFTSSHGKQIGTGFNFFDSILTPGTWTGDGHQALIGRLPGGAIRLYESDESADGGFTTSNGVQIGTGFNAFSTMLTLGDWSGDRQMDLLGITGNGTLLLYNTDGHGNFLNNNGIAIGSGWQGLRIF